QISRCLFLLVLCTIGRPFRSEMEWPACGSDLNQIKHFWDQLDLEILVEECDGVFQQCVTQLVTRMRRGQAVVRWSSSLMHYRAPVCYINK
uniref:Uncharacterized protein n=1 Tax=Fundulus heteroclitus TaxID=8078 RepID=A0A3Q2Q7X7_FUNHE